MHKKIGIFLAAFGLTIVVTSAAVYEHGTNLLPSLPATVTDFATPHRRVPSYDSLPIRFEPNVGQGPPQTRYLARGNGYDVAITDQGAILSFRHGASPQKNGAESATHVRIPPASRLLARLGLHLVHARTDPRLRAERQQSSFSNYFIGNDPSKWHLNVPNYAAIRYEQIYPGIDWVVYGNPQQLEYDFIVAPRSDPGQIELEMDGAGSLSLDGHGELLVNVQDASLRQPKPVIYQATADGERHYIDGHYVLNHQHIAFALGEYDDSRELVIDPVFVYSTYLGGSGGDSAAAIAVDNEGNAYVAGATSSTDFPTIDLLRATHHSAAPVFRPTNAFVAKFNAAGTKLVYSTYLGGSGYDEAYGIAVDSEGNAYVAGQTTSTDFPTFDAFQATNHSVSPTFPGNAFVTKLNASGGVLVYSTYLGGSGPKGGDAQSDSAYAIAVDSEGNAYVAGRTASTDFPTFDAFQATNHAVNPVSGGGVLSSNAFVTKFNAAGSALVYSTYLGGSYSDGATGIAIDSAGSAYVVGATASTDFPTAAPFQASNNATGVGLLVNDGGGYTTAFLTKFNAAGSALVYSTYLGGTSQESAAGVAVDGDDNAYVVGATTSTDFPIVNPLQAENHSVSTNNPFNAFVTKFNAAGSALVYSTYLGGSGDDRGHAIAVGSAGNANVAGLAYSRDFPLADGLQGTNNGAINGAANAFVSVLNATGSALEFSTYLGGSGSVTAAQRGGVDSAAAIAVDRMGNLYVAGSTYSTDFPTVMAFQDMNKATNTGTSGTAFVTKIAMASPPAREWSTRGGGGALGWGWLGALGLTVAVGYRRGRKTQGCRALQRGAHRLSHQRR